MSHALLKIAATDACTVAKDAKVRDAVDEMVRAHRGAVSVMDDDKVVGVFTERDVMEKVVHKGLDPAATAVSEVMASPPVSVREETKREEAIDLMVRHRFRHLPIVDPEGRLVGMLSLRDLLGHQLTRLKDEINSLEHYLLCDGPGG